MENDVYVAKTEPMYPKFPYDDVDNPLFCSLCDLFKAWGRDPDNPFGGFVEQGGVVVIKPNWVVHRNKLGYDIESLVTHCSLIKYIIDFAAKALDGRGTIVIGDAPIQGCDFQKLLELSRMVELLRIVREKYPDITFELEDWRLTVTAGYVSSPPSCPGHTTSDSYAAMTKKDFVLVDLGKDSFLEDIVEYCENFRVVSYKKSLMLAHHRQARHEYLVTNRLGKADLLVNLPKMKTHMKAGLTGALKNIVGINGHKEYLAHHIKGSYSQGGDAYASSHPFRGLHENLSEHFWEKYAECSSVSRRLLSYFLDALRWSSVLCGGQSTSLGSWSGNETIWRTILDLNHILYFSEYAPKKVITIVDGIIAGEGQGPLKPTPRPSGFIIAGQNPAYIDAVIAKLFGYNISRIPMVQNAIYDRRSKFAGPSLSEFMVTSILKGLPPEKITFKKLPNLNFKKPRYWQHAEVKLVNR